MPITLPTSPARVSNGRHHRQISTACWARPSQELSAALLAPRRRLPNTGSPLWVPSSARCSGQVSRQHQPVVNGQTNSVLFFRHRG